MRACGTDLIRNLDVAEILELQRWSDSKLDELSGSFSPPIDAFILGGYDDASRQPPILSAAADLPGL